jgi:hypothetical protein
MADFKVVYSYANVDGLLLRLTSFDKAEPNSQFSGKYIRNNLISIRGSLIYKLSGTPDKEANAPRSPFSLPSFLN